MDPESSPRPMRSRLGWTLIAAGILAVVAATLSLSSAGYGTRVRREFGDRRTYDMVKPAVHERLPFVLVLGLGGLSAILLGARVRRGAAPRDDVRRA